MKRFLPLVLVVVVVGSALRMAHAGGVAGLEVKMGALTSGVDGEKNFVTPEIDPALPLKHGPVYLWTVLTGNAQTLAEIKRKGRWPVRHRWTFLGPQGREAERVDDRNSDAEELPVGSVRRTAGLAAEVAGTDAFEWRTWTGKRRLQRGVYQVEVIFADDTPVMQGGKASIYKFVYEP